ncbi:MAG: PKD domain-containing protein [Candidatus Bathyarchaeia archaeon]
MPRIRCPNCGLTIDLESRKEVDFSQIFNALKGKERTFTELLHITHLPRKTLSLRLKALCKQGLIVKDNGGYRLMGSWTSEPYRISKVGEKMEKIYNSLKNHYLTIALVLCLLTYIGVPIMVHALGWLNETPKAKIFYEQPPSIDLSASFTISSTPEAQYAKYYYIDYNNELTFDASSSKGNIVDYLWDFGDGTSGRGIVTTHKYTAPGNYIVSLIVVGKDSFGSLLKVITRQNIVVLPYPKTHIYLDNSLDGDYLRVNVVIVDVEDLYGWQISANFNGLEIKEVVKGSFFEILGDTIFLVRDLEETPNRIDFIVGTLRGNVAGANGGGVLVTLTFHILHEDYNVSLESIELLNSNVQWIPYIYA